LKENGFEMIEELSCQLPGGSELNYVKPHPKQLVSRAEI
jgi:hypothetical protein